MKVLVTIERTTFEYKEIEMDEKFRACADPAAEFDQAFNNLLEEAANSAAEILGIPLAGDKEEEEAHICGAVCIDNGELMFEV